MVQFASQSVNLSQRVFQIFHLLSPVHLWSPIALLYWKNWEYKGLNKTLHVCVWEDGRVKKFRPLWMTLTFQGHNTVREGIVALYAVPNPFLLNNICLNQHCKTTFWAISQFPLGKLSPHFNMRVRALIF